MQVFDCVDSKTGKEYQEAIFIFSVVGARLGRGKVRV